jgi:hypothetical protein
MKNSGTRIFFGLCVAAALLVTGYVWHVKQRMTAPDIARPTVQQPGTRRPAALQPPAASGSAPAPVPATAAAATEATANTAQASAPAARSLQRLFFRSTTVDQHYGSVGWVDLAQPRAVHYVDSLRCEVVYVAGGHGICLSAERGVFTTYAASLFDTRAFKVSASFPLKGIPSRARVSIDGKLAAFTVFVSGHGYTTLDFSTQTLIIDVRSAALLADLEDFEVRRNGAVIKAADFNFWGVTFTPDARQFYATLSTAGEHLLIRGDIATRQAEVLHENVECPSLSPDARHVAYKKRLLVDGRIVWQLHVLELGSGREIPLAEKRSIDDQLEWLDSRHVLYSVPSADDGSSPGTDVWSAAIDSKSAPVPFMRNAYSPATARCLAAAACAAASP